MVSRPRTNMPMDTRPNVALAYGIAMQAEVGVLERQNTVQLWDPEGLDTMFRILQRHSIQEPATIATLIAFSASFGNPINRIEVKRSFGLPIVQIIDGVLYMLECVRQNDIDEGLSYARRMYSGKQKSHVLASFAAFQVYTMVAVDARKKEIIADDYQVSSVEGLLIPEFVMLYDSVLRAVARIQHPIYDDFAERWAVLRQELQPSITIND